MESTNELLKTERNKINQNYQSQPTDVTFEPMEVSFCFLRVLLLMVDSNKTQNN